MEIMRREARLNPAYRDRLGDAKASLDRAGSTLGLVVSAVVLLLGVGAFFVLWVSGRLLWPYAVLFGGIVVVIASMMAWASRRRPAPKPFPPVLFWREGDEVVFAAGAHATAARYPASSVTARRRKRLGRRWLEITTPDGVRQIPDDVLDDPEDAWALLQR